MDLHERRSDIVSEHFLYVPYHLLLIVTLKCNDIFLNSEHEDTQYFWQCKYLLIVRLISSNRHNFFGITWRCQAEVQDLTRDLSFQVGF